MLVLTHHEHWAGRVAHHPFRRAPEEKAPQTGSAVGRDNNQIGLQLSGRADDFLVRRARPHKRLCGHIAGFLADQLSQRALAFTLQLVTIALHFDDDAGLARAVRDFNYVQTEELGAKLTRELHRVLKRLPRTIGKVDRHENFLDVE